MESDRRLSLVVGSFVLLSLLAMATAILLLSSGSALFESSYRLVARFENVQGLLPGAPVWLAGKEVGRVSSVRFGAIDSATPVVVDLRIIRSVRERIRADSMVSVETVGLLGDSYVEVGIGSSEAAPLEDGDEIEALSPSNLNEVITTGKTALNNVATLAENLNTVILSFSPSYVWPTFTWGMCGSSTHC